MKGLSKLISRPKVAFRSDQVEQRSDLGGDKQPPGPDYKVAVLGHRGTGKTCLLKALALFDWPTPPWTPLGDRKKPITWLEQYTRKDLCDEIRSSMPVGNDDGPLPKPTKAKELLYQVGIDTNGASVTLGFYDFPGEACEYRLNAMTALPPDDRIGSGSVGSQRQAGAAQDSPEHAVPGTREEAGSAHDKKGPYEEVLQEALKADALLVCLSPEEREDEATGNQYAGLLEDLRSKGFRGWVALVATKCDRAQPSRKVAPVRRIADLDNSAALGTGERPVVRAIAAFSKDQCPLYSDFSRYEVAAMPEDPEFRPWERRGIVTLFRDVLEAVYLRSAKPISKPVGLQWCLFGWLLFGALLATWLLYSRPRETAFRQFRAVLQEVCGTREPVMMLAGWMMGGDTNLDFYTHINRLLILNPPSGTNKPPTHAGAASQGDKPYYAVAHFNLIERDVAKWTTSLRFQAMYLLAEPGKLSARQIALVSPWAKPFAWEDLDWRSRNVELDKEWALLKKVRLSFLAFTAAVAKLKAVPREGGNLALNDSKVLNATSSAEIVLDKAIDSTRAVAAERASLAGQLRLAYRRALNASTTNHADVGFMDLVWLISGKSSWHFAYSGRFSGIPKTFQGLLHSATNSFGIRYSPEVTVPSLSRTNSADWVQTLRLIEVAFLQPGQETTTGLKLVPPMNANLTADQQRQDEGEIEERVRNRVLEWRRSVLPHVISE